jgi:GNAT superfamily N-acetyltransferase
VAENGGEIAALASVTGAEAAVLVEDAWQRQGLGMRVLERAVDDAARHGVTELAADVAFDSPHALRMLSRLGAATVSVTPEGYRLVMKLATRAEPCSTARTTRRTARSRARSRS